MCEVSIVYASAMVELHTLETEDGCLLDAAYWPAAKVASGRADGCVFTHGATGNAFSPFQRDMGEALSAAGIATVSINTRGHDIVSRLVRRDGVPARGGTAFEDLDDAAFDLHAGAAFLRDRGASRLAIGGHSLGAVKSIFVQATRPIEGATCLVAVSPPRIAWEVQTVGPMAKRFGETRAEALRLIAEGRGDELIDATVPIPSRFGAAQYEKKYGPESRYDVARCFDSVGVPVFFLFGTTELSTMHQIGASGAAAGAWTKAHPDSSNFVLIEGADHSYTGLRDRATAAVVDWLTSPT